MDVHSVQDSGTMPLIAEILLAVSVGCVEIRNTAAEPEGDEMDSYQVNQSNSALFKACLPLSVSLKRLQSELKSKRINFLVRCAGKRPGTFAQAVVICSHQETGIPRPAPAEPGQQSR